MYDAYARDGGFGNLTYVVMCLHKLFSPLLYTDEDGDDGSESIVSSGTAASEEGPNHHLLNVPSGDVAFVKEKPPRL
ncbi:hypothetical protein TB2_031608 [Malus domestica]